MAVAEEKSAPLEFMKEVDVTRFNGGRIQKGGGNVDPYGADLRGSSYASVTDQGSGSIRYCVAIKISVNLLYLKCTFITNVKIVKRQ